MADPIMGDTTSQVAAAGGGAAAVWGFSKLLSYLPWRKKPEDQRKDHEMRRGFDRLEAALNMAAERSMGGHSETRRVAERIIDTQVDIHGSLKEMLRVNEQLAENARVQEARHAAVTDRVMAMLEGYTKPPRVKTTRKP